MKHTRELSAEELAVKLYNLGVTSISISDDNFNVGDTVRYQVRKKDGTTETHVFEITAVKNVKIINQFYLGCVD